MKQPVGFAVDSKLKICGTCAYRRSSVCLSMRLVQACVDISQNPDEVDAATLTVLIREAEVLRRRKYKCGKEPNAWTHLIDRACAFWQPKEQGFSLGDRESEGKTRGAFEAIRRLGV